MSPSFQHLCANLKFCKIKNNNFVDQMMGWREQIFLGLPFFRQCEAQVASAGKPIKVFCPVEAKDTKLRAVDQQKSHESVGFFLQSVTLKKWTKNIGGWFQINSDFGTYILDSNIHSAYRHQSISNVSAWFFANSPLKQRKVIQLFHQPSPSPKNSSDVHSKVTFICWKKISMLLSYPHSPPFSKQPKSVAHRLKSPDASNFPDFDTSAHDF